MPANFMLSGLAHQIAVKDKIDQTSANIAMAKRVPGQQRHIPVFKQVLTGQTVGGSKYFTPPHGFIVRSGTIRDVSSGTFEDTGQPLHFAISGPAYFSLQTPQGETVYTKNGKFRLNGENQISDNKGNLLLADGAPIQIPVGTKMANFRVKEDGTMMTDDGPLGKMSLVRFKDQQKMDPDTNGNLRTNQPELGLEDEEGRRLAFVQQGYLEDSNIVNITEMSALLNDEKSFKRVSNFMESEQRRRMEFFNAIPGNR